MKNIILIAVAILILVGGGLYIFTSTNNQLVENEVIVPVDVATSTEVTPTVPETATSSEVAVDKTKSVLGTSAGGEEILAYHFGTGEYDLLFVGGIHGGYSWNTSLLAFELIDWLKENPEKIPNNVKVTIIPVLNPDGLKQVTGSTGKFEVSDVNTAETARVAGRFNANDVDLNRNFDCAWEAEGTWQSRTVSGGEKAFSEPESQAIKNYIDRNQPNAVVVWYSAAGGVYSSNCESKVSVETRELTKLFADAANYTAHEEFDYYEITGDMVNWVAGQGLPAISVLLTNHTDTEFEKNLAGLQAVMDKYAE